MKPLRGRRGAAAGREACAELADALGEFDAVMEDFSSGRQEQRRPHYEEHLRQMKRRRSSAGGGAGDSEREGRASFGADSLYRNSFSLSDEKLNAPALSAPTAATSTIAAHKAKLGDTKELEEFIADLDRTLASM